MKITLLLGSGVTSHYESGLLSGLIGRIADIDIIGGEMRDSEIPKAQNVQRVFLSARADSTASVKEKCFQIIRFYLRLAHYTFTTNSTLFHIQWLNKFVLFDRVVLPILYKLFGKKLVFTAHNVDAEARDGKSSFMNRCSLRFFYRFVDHVIVHTEKMRLQLIGGFGVDGRKVTVIPHGVIHIAERFNITKSLARKQLSIKQTEKIILFFGNIAPYKGLEYLLLAIPILKTKLDNFRVLIAGEIKKQYEHYWSSINSIIAEHELDPYLTIRKQFIPDEEVELHFKSADVLVLPYKEIFQTGVLFLSYGFGLPVIATDVGSLREDIIEGRTGFICHPEDPVDLAHKVAMYFESELFKMVEANRKLVIDYANEKYSWEKIGEHTCSVYYNLLPSQ